MIPRWHTVHMLGNLITVDARVEDNAGMTDPTEGQSNRQAGWSTAKDEDIDA